MYPNISVKEKTQTKKGTNERTCMMPEKTELQRLTLKLGTDFFSLSPVAFFTSEI